MSTQVHVGTRVGSHVAGGRQMEGPRVSGPWLGNWAGNANALPHPTFYMRNSSFLLPCGTMFPHDLPFPGDVDARQASDSIRTMEIVWTRVHTILNQARARYIFLSERDQRTYLTTRGGLGIVRSSSNEGRAITI